MLNLRFIWELKNVHNVLFDPVAADKCLGNNVPTKYLIMGIISSQ